MIEDCIDFFIEDFSVGGSFFEKYLVNLKYVLKRCQKIILVLNLEKRHLMAQEGIVLGYKCLSKALK